MGRAKPSTPSSATSPDARVLLGDCVEVMATFPDASIDAVVTDPPYGLEFMGKEWDTFGAKRARIGRGGHLDRGDGEEKWAAPRPQAYVAGTSYQEWTELWAHEALRVLRPGGHLLAFGGTRTYHRMAVGIEDAGFEIRDSLHWVYGSGFPKSLDVGKAIDRTLGGVREVVGQARGIDPAIARPQFAGAAHSKVPNVQKMYDLTLPATSEAKQWHGWGTGLKPAHEPVLLARKPLSGSVAATVIEHGTGAINIDGTRVGTSGGIHTLDRPKSVTGVTDFPAHASKIEHLDAGRWPSNLMLAHLPECQGSGSTHTDVLCAPGCPVAELNEASGGPGGGAARFFFVAKPRTRERVGGTLRNLHPTVKPIDLMRYLVRLVTPPGGAVLDPFLGSGTTGCAAMVEGFGFIGIEREQQSYETALARVSDYAFANGRAVPQVL